MFKHISLIVLFVFLLLAVPVFDAQPVQSAPGATPRATPEATAQPTVAATAAVVEPAATPEATAPAVILAPAVDVTPVPETLPSGSGYVSVLAAILIGIVAAIAGSFVGGISVMRFMVNFLERVNRDTALLNAIEGLTTSVPADILQALNAGAKIVDKVTDQKPNLPSMEDFGVIMSPGGDVTIRPGMAPGFVNQVEAPHETKGQVG